MADYSAGRAGLSLLVMKNGHDAKTPRYLASATKSFWGVAAAMDDGLLALNERASGTLTE